MLAFMTTKRTFKGLKQALYIIGALVFVSCNSGPKIVEAEADAKDIMAPTTSQTTKTHKVVVKEVLQTSKYTYLNVSEDEEEKWIAAPKTEAVVGETYYYRGGLKKTNFKSVEHNRVFETVYLVSGISKNPSGVGMPAGHVHTNMSPQADMGKLSDPPPGGITIADLFENRTKYDGQKVRIRGRCVKVNNMIMDRNWVHLQDDSLDEDKDLTITTTENIPLGAVVAVEGIITLNKDFGAGYKYEIIMEEAQLLK